MAQRITVKDEQTGRTVTFDWDGEQPPTEADLAEVFASARSEPKEGVNPTFEQRINAGEFNAPAPTGPRPNSPADLTRRGFEKLFGGFGGQMQDAAAAGLRLSPLGLTTQMIEGGAPAGGMFGGTAGAALGGPMGGVAGATVGGGAGGAMRRWWQGEPTSGGDVALDTVGQGALQAVAPVIGSAVQGVAKPLYRAALSPGGAIAKTFGDVAKTGLDEGIPVGTGQAERAAGLTGASRAKALRMVQEAEQAGAPAVDETDVLPALDRVFRKSRDAASVGADPPVPRLIDRSRKIDRAFSGGVPVTRAQTLKEVAQDEAAQAFSAADRGARVSTLDDEAAADIAVALQQAIEQRVPGVAGQNAKTKALLGLTKALENADARRVGGSGLPSRSLASLLAVPQVASRVGIGLNRTGKGVKDYGPMVTNLLRMLAAQGNAQEP